MKNFVLILLASVFTSITVNAQVSGKLKFRNDILSSAINWPDVRTDYLKSAIANEYQKLDSAVRTDMFKNYYYYDNEGRNNEIVVNEWKDQQWLKESKYVILYAVTGNFSILLYSWNVQSSEWLIESKVEYTFVDNLPLNILVSDLVDNQWIKQSKIDLTIDSNKNFTTEIGFVWDTNNAKWENDYKYEYAYGTNNKRSLKNIWIWNVDQWSNTSKTTYAYDANNNMILYTDYELDISTGTWMQTYKGEFAYDLNNRPILTIHYLPLNDNQWINGRKINYTYAYTCSPGNLKLPLFQDFYYDEFVDITTASYTMRKWDDDAKDWYITYNVDKYFSNIVLTDIDKPVPFSSICVYPNPANSTLYLSGLNGKAMVSIYDISGALILSRQILKGQLDVSSLKNGLYTLKIEYLKGIEIRRFLKQ